MPYKYQRFYDNKRGTQYGIYVHEVMIHCVYSKKRALEILNALNSGSHLSEEIAIDIASEEQRKYREDLKAEVKKSDELARELYHTKQQLAELKKQSEKNGHFPQESKVQEVKSPTLPERETPKTKSPSIALKYKMSSIEAEELEELISEVKGKGFRYSKELSSYIIKNNLKKKYPNISGVVKMERSGEQWDFSGGFPKRIYGIVCNELGLSDQGSRAKAVGFKSFKELDQPF